MIEKQIITGQTFDERALPDSDIIIDYAAADTIATFMKQDQAKYLQNNPLPDTVKPQPPRTSPMRDELFHHPSPEMLALDQHIGEIAAKVAKGQIN